MAILIPIAFAAGVVTAFSPCVLPVLPVILAGGGASETRRRPYAIVAGLVTTFTVFTLAGAWIWSELHISAKYQIRIGAVMLLVLAVTLLVPRAGELLERPFLFLTRRRAGDLGGGFFLGASLGLVFVPCTGPVLGAVITNVGSHRVGFVTVLLALVYALGLALPMVLVAQGSRRITASFRMHAQTVRVVAGIAMAAVAVVLYTGPKWLTNIQKDVPGYINALERVERTHVARKALARLNGRSGTSPSFRAVPADAFGAENALARVPLGHLGVAPNFRGISHWLNTPGLSLPALRGKVVLIDFWTYSCINCLRTLPHLEAWDKRYRGKGLVIVGVHTPEFAFEHDLGNVRSAVARLGVRYPVALDNDYATWNAYSNQYWPAEYLVDQNGEVRHVHFGEGSYGETENDIRLLLRAGGRRTLPAPARQPDLTPTGDITPESYLGYFRIQRYAGSRLQANVQADYRFPQTLGRDELAYAGTWKVESERIVAGNGARLRLHFHARNVHLVLGGRGVVGVSVDGHAQPSVHVDGDRLYTLFASSQLRDALLELAFTPGLQAYAFTFG